MTRLVALLLLIVFCYCHSWCGHEKIAAAEAQANRRSYKLSKKRSAVQNNFQPIRIIFDTSSLDNDGDRNCKTVNALYRRGNPPSQTVRCEDSPNSSNCWGTCTAEMIVDATKVSRVQNTILPSAERYLEGLLSVRRLTNNLLFSQTFTTCGAEGGVTVPSQYRTTGTPNDLLIFVTMRPTGEGTLAWAIECASDGSSAQPRAGQVNINPTVFGNNFSPDQFNGILIHEITHILGFSSNKYSAFVGSDGATPLGNANVVQSFVRTVNGESKTIQRIITPRVADTVRQQFGCSSANGMELEENGGSGTAGSHWEKRLVMNDFMIGAASWFNPSDNYTVSSLTLALLEDSGWYKPDYTQAGSINWGRNTGCNMLTTTCPNWNVDREGYFCSDTNNRNSYCTFELTGKGYCGIGQYNAALPPYYRYFTNALLGGIDANMDYCPVITRYSNADCKTPRTTDIGPYEVYGANSACFDSSVGATSQPQTRAASCYEHRCARTTGNTTTLQVRINDRWFDCGNDNTEKRITALGTGLTGYVKCSRDAYRILCANKAGITPSGNVIDPSNPGSNSQQNCLIFNLFCSSAATSSVSFIILLVSLLVYLF